MAPPLSAAALIGAFVLLASSGAAGTTCPVRTLLADLTTRCPRAQQRTRACCYSPVLASAEEHAGPACMCAVAAEAARMGINLPYSDIAERCIFCGALNGNVLRRHKCIAPRPAPAAASAHPKADSQPAPSPPAAASTQAKADSQAS